VTGPPSKPRSACRPRLVGSVGLTITVRDQQREFRAGDRVIVTRNDYPRGLLNGTRATVTAVQAAGLTLRTDDRRTLTVSSGWLVQDRLDHAYALTVHKAQGLTVDVTLFYGTAALSREAGYVGLSRGRRANHLYTTLAADDTNRCGPHAQRLDDPDLRTVLSHRLARSGAQHLALTRAPSLHPARAAARHRSQSRGLGR
jgi:hypothetical protein